MKNLRRGMMVFGLTLLGGMAVQAKVPTTMSKGYQTCLLLNEDHQGGIRGMAHIQAPPDDDQGTPAMRWFMVQLMDEATGDLVYPASLEVDVRFPDGRFLNQPLTVAQGQPAATRLPLRLPGKYDFRVKAVLKDGVERLFYFFGVIH